MKWSGIVIFLMVVLVLYKKSEREDREREKEFNNKLREMNKEKGLILDKFVLLSNGDFLNSNGDTILKTDLPYIRPNKK